MALCQKLLRPCQRRATLREFSLGKRTLMILWFFVAQVLGAGLMAVLVSFQLLTIHSLLTFALLQGLCAAAFSIAMRGARWWLPIHLVFLPAVVLVSGLHVDSGWYLAAFLILALTYWSTFQSRVPLYLSNAATAQAILELIPVDATWTVADAGCGTGSLLVRLARARPASRFEGVEIAPLPWLIARVRMRQLSNAQVHRSSFWSWSFAGQDLVYVFLSPVPMPRIWEKACAEMRPGSLLVSNSFVIPDVPPERIIQVEDRRSTRLYLYRLKERTIT
jgi:hypothetical protein